MWVCPKCGNHNETSFCTRCGRRDPGERPTGDDYTTYYVAPIPVRGIIKENAKVAISLQNKTAVRLWLAYWGLSIAAGVVSALLWPLLSVIGNLVVVILFSQILLCGEHFAALMLYRKQHIETNALFSGFKNYGHTLGGMLWWNLWVSLWSIIPVMDVIKMYSYSMTPFILMDHPELTARQALKKSIQMTEGRKMDLFVLDLSFIGWQLLNILTLGILGIFYVMPYYMTAWAGYYAEIEAATSGGHNLEQHTGRFENRTPPVQNSTEFPTSVWVCANCGKRNDMRFCTGCGMTREDSNSSRPPVHTEKPPLTRTGASGGERRTETRAETNSGFKRPKGF